jgi:hypothetical protein
VNAFQIAQHTLQIEVIGFGAPRSSSAQALEVASARVLLSRACFKDR